MTNTFSVRAGDVTPIDDPTSESGLISIFAEALGQDGRPYVLFVEDPPNKTRPRHFHHGDVVYVYTAGEHRIEGERTYRAGDIRWTRAGHTYGPEATGPDGGAWWIITSHDPIPVEPSSADEAQVSTPAESMSEVPRSQSPHDWSRIVQLTLDPGAVIVEQLFDPELLQQFDDEIDIAIKHAGDLRPDSGDTIYNIFLGERTVRLHGLAAKAPSADGLISNSGLVDWATTTMADVCSSVLLNAAELIQIGAGEPAQFLHRDSDSWQAAPRGMNPVVVNAIVALDDFTLENGATHLALGSSNWHADRTAQRGELSRAVMRRGDAILFRGDLIHGGGANTTPRHRRALSLSYCAGWLRPVENHQLNISIDQARQLSATTQALLGYQAHIATATRGGMLGLFEGGQPHRALESAKENPA